MSIDYAERTKKYYEAKKAKRNADKSLWVCPACKNRYKDRVGHARRHHCMTYLELVEYAKGLDKLDKI